MDAQMEEALKNLLANNFDAKHAENSNAVKRIVSSSISKNTIVGIGDSATVGQTGIIEELEKEGIKVLNPPFSRELTTDRTKTALRDNISRQIFSCDVFVCGTNTVTMDGKLVNIDAVGNRVASMIFGP